MTTRSKSHACPILNYMSMVHFKIFSPSEQLREYVECFRIADSDSNESMAIRVCPNGSPGIAFHHHGGDSAIRRIATPLRRDDSLPTLFLYGQVTTVSEMHFIPPYASLQVVFKPDALSNLFNLDASLLLNKSLEAKVFDAVELNTQLIAVQSDEARVALCSDFLAAKLAFAQGSTPIRKALKLINQQIATANVEAVRKYIGLSERQFERQFKQVVGVSPHLYMRIRRINAALRLMDSGKYSRLADVAHELHFHDQSHFIRDMKEFAGLTPKSLLQKVDDFYHDQVGSSYLIFDGFLQFSHGKPAYNKRT